MSDQLKEDIQWTDKKQLEYAENFFNVYSKKIKEEPEKAIEELLAHVAVQKYQEFDATLKNQGKNFSKRLEKLENGQQ